jgi:hypothetical protein
MTDRRPRLGRQSPLARRALWAAALVVGVLAGPAARHAAAAPSPADVEVALQKARLNLYGKMKPDVFWEEVPTLDVKGPDHEPKGKQWGGLSAISTYALLASGVNHQDPQLKPAVDWVKKQRLIGNYAIGLRAQLWAFLPPTPENRQLAIKDKVYLEKGMHQVPVAAKKGDNDRIGFYPYWFNDDPRKMHPGGNSWDLSVSQYGVLGMWACEQVDGVEVPAEYWALVDKSWKAAQFKDGPDAGAWAYQRGGSGKNPDWEKPRGTMTAAGVATLFITQDYLLQYANFANCKGGANNQAIDLGLAWMDKNVEALLKGNHYGMYGVERIGVASGKKYFGKVDWYDVGADYLVKTQAKDGSWGGSVPNTCFAMLFLSRGRAPVIMNKLEYEIADPAHKAVKLPWDQRPRDVANIAKYAQKNAEQYFNWQVVNLKVGGNDLLDAPILYVSGSLPLDFPAADVAQLKNYCDAGGLVLFNADCGDAGFVQSVVGPQGIARKTFPKYEFRELPPNHPIYADEVYLAKNWKTKPKVLGLSNGVRELMLVIPEADAGRAWQTKAEKSKEELYQLGVNVFYYAAEKGQFKYRGDTHVVTPDPKAVPAVRVKVARLMVGDNPDPEPYGWRRLAAVLLNTAKVGAVVEPVKLGEGKLIFSPAGVAAAPAAAPAAGAPAGTPPPAPAAPAPVAYQIAHLTGTTKFKLTDPQKAELKKFTAAGGTLVVDAAGGSADFADAAERELAGIFGGEPAAVGPIIPPDELPYAWTGFKIAKVDYRKYSRNRVNGKLNAPRVRGIDVGNKTRVFYSREDLSAGLTGQPCDGIVGYDAATATAIMRNVVLYAAYNGKAPKPPATSPAAKPAAPAGTPAVPAAPAAAPAKPATPAAAPAAAPKLASPAAQAK